MKGIQEWLYASTTSSPMAAAGAAAGARSVHPADEAQEHAPSSDGRGADHAPRAGVLPVVTRRARGVILVAAIGLLVAAWPTVRAPRAPGDPRRLHAKSYVFSITSDPIAAARAEKTSSTPSSVRDRKTRPADRERRRAHLREHRATGARTWDGFDEGAGVGTYTAKLRFVDRGPVGDRHSVPPRLHAAAREDRVDAGRASPNGERERSLTMRHFYRTPYLAGGRPRGRRCVLRRARAHARDHDGAHAHVHRPARCAEAQREGRRRALHVRRGRRPTRWARAASIAT